MLSTLLNAGSAVLDAVDWADVLIALAKAIF